MIYLDNAATTQPLEQFTHKAQQLLRQHWYNPSGVYAPAVGEHQSMEQTRWLCERRMQDRFRCIFTSGGTESAMLALQGSYRSGRILSTLVEHPCVYENLMTMQRKGAGVEFVRTDGFGRVDEDDFREKLSEDVSVVSVMHVNNITGAINDVTRLYEITKQVAPQAVFHSDGVQGFAKLAPPKCDIYTASAHKIGGLKGTGMLFLDKQRPFSGRMPGGGQESGIRSGTENTLGIAALGVALEFWQQEHIAHMQRCKTELAQKITAQISDVVINSPQDGAPHILNLSILGVGGEIVLHALEEDGILISTGSACSSRRREVRISKALGMDKEQTDAQIRLSFTHDTPLEELDFVVEKMKNITQKHRKMMKGRA